MPRRYRGRDIAWWLEASGILGERAERAFDIESARLQPSLQLVGTPNQETIDLAILRDEGVRLVGRVDGANGTRMSFCSDLRRNIDAAELKLDRVLDRIDRFIDETCMAADSPDRRPAIEVSEAPSELDLRDAGIASVLWATGYRRRYSWLQVPVLNIRGEIIHDAGVTPSAGVYVLGLNFQRTRKSSFIDGVGDDARAVTEHLSKRFHRSSIAA
jgi:putative flavoprotein involved in K+ transport